jgi:ATP-dependent Lhr-like helicase
VVARSREPADWERDVAAARPTESRVHAALEAHPLISHISNYTEEFDVPDFEFRLDGREVRLEVKAKTQPYSVDYAELWPEIPPSDLFVLDETSYRRLLWGDGMGFVLVEDQPRRQWHAFGPWELCLGPRRRFQRQGNRGAGPFLKGKLLLDLRTAAATTPDVSVDVLVSVVRASRRDLARVEAVGVRTREALPLVPKELERAATVVQTVADPTPATPERVSEVEVDSDPRWQGLSPQLVGNLRRRFGWEEPTEVQRLAIGPVLAGDNVLILAPTAGGKTEAALLPLLDRLDHGSSRVPAILAVSPLKALLDDQLARYERLGALVGATAFAWHGDVPWDRKSQFLDAPATMLLTTPESLEVFLTSPRRDHLRLLSTVEAVIVDEVHAFVGTTRGAQLASIIERIDRFAEADLQRVGLSATVGNPAEVLDWLRGGSLRPHRFVSVQTKSRGEQVRVASYVDLAGAVTTIGSLVEDSTALVFARSRRRAEELANGLAVPVHHSSVSASGRQHTVHELASGTRRCIVATASLEMGIDLGEIDLIVHDGPPTGPASYLQRLGRAGRRTGLRKLVFTTDQPDDLLLILGVLARVRRGDIERLQPRRGARLVLGQQALALAMERTVVRRRELADALRWAPSFSASALDIDLTLAHLVADGWLMEVDDKLVVGPKAAARFDGQRLGDLAVTFDAGGGARVMDEDGRHVGDVDWTQLDDDSLDRRDRLLLLAGRSWEVQSVDRASGTVVVRAARSGKPVSWRGPTLEVDRPTWLAAREVLLDTDVPVAMDGRAEAWLTAARAQWRPRLEHPVRTEDGAVVVDSFAGAAAHRIVLDALQCEGVASGISCTLALPLADAVARAQAALESLDDVVTNAAVRVAATLGIRHRELVPPVLLAAEAREFHVDADGVRSALALIAEA